MLDKSLIADLPPFEGMDAEHVAKLLASGQSQRFAKDAHIFRQGSDAQNFYLLLDGYVRVVKGTLEGKQVIVRYINSGELFGIAKAIGQTIYPANGIAAIDCVVLVWPSSIWDATVANNPAFAQTTCRTIGNRLLETQDQLVELATKRVEQRVASALVRLVTYSAKQTDNGLLIDFPISRQDLSEMTGTTLHTVSRLLSAWETAGLINSGRQRVSVLRSDKLATIASGEA